MNYTQTDKTPQYRYKLYNMDYGWHDQPKFMPVASLTQLEAHLKNRAYAMNQVNKKYVQVSDRRVN